MKLHVGFDGASNSYLLNGWILNIVRLENFHGPAITMRRDVPRKVMANVLYSVQSKEEEVFRDGKLYTLVLVLGVGACGHSKNGRKA